MKVFEVLEKFLNFTQNCLYEPCNSSLVKMSWSAIATSTTKITTASNLQRIILLQDLEIGPFTYKFGNFRERFIFAKIKPSLNNEITLSFTDVGHSESCPGRKFLVRYS